MSFKMDPDKPIVAVVGVGALGSHLVHLLRNLDVNWVVIDDDTVEMKNVMSQFYEVKAARLHKANTILRMFRQMYKRANVFPQPVRLVANNIDVILADADLIVDCVDNGETRRLIQRFAKKHGFPCLHGGLSADGKFGTVAWTETFQIDNEDVVGQPTCDGGEFLPFIVMVASLMAMHVQTFIKEGKKRPNYNCVPGSISHF